MSERLESDTVEELMGEALSLKGQVSSLKKTQDVLKKQLKSQEALIEELRDYLGPDNFQSILLHLKYKRGGKNSRSN